MRIRRLLLSSMLAVGVAALNAPPASADGSTVYLDTTAASTSPSTFWVAEPGDGVGMKVDATGAATITTATLVFGSMPGGLSPIAVGSSVQLWSVAGDGRMGELIGSLSYASASGSTATYSGSVDIPAGEFWVKAANTGSESAVLAYAKAPVSTGPWQLVYGLVASEETMFGTDIYFDNDSGRILLSLSSDAPTTSGPGAAPPPDQIQQVGMPAGGSCAAVDDSHLRYGTGVSGGWSASWAAWINGGAGGVVCTRTLHYSDAAGGWIVR